MSTLPEPPLLPEVDDADRVIGLIARLPHNSVVRRIALQVIQGRQVDSLQPLALSLRTPHHKRWRERFAAAWTLGRAPAASEERDSAVQLLLDIVDRSYREPFWSRVKRSAIYAAVGVAAMYVIASINDAPNVTYPDQLVAILAAMYCVAGVFALPLTFWNERWNNNQLRSVAAEALGCLGAIDAISTLAEALRDPNPDVREAAAQALHKLLPLVTSEHYGALGTQTMANLGSALSHPDGQLVFKILAALERAGTSAAIPYVERAFRRGRTMRVRESAEAVLKVLQERQIRETDRDRLLRATTGVHDTNLLLRPHASTAEDPALLLQPAADGR